MPELKLRPPEENGKELWVGLNRLWKKIPGLSFQAAHGTGVHDERGKIIIACVDRVYSAM
jgi:hypothetical protein